MTGLLLRAYAENHRALCTHDLTGLHPADETRAMAGTNPPAPGTPATLPACAPPPGARAGATRAANLADAVPVAQVTWTSAQHIAADVPERH
ncbi:hypothetical protein SAMN05443287_12225 [Micromonospora phaseoli]|uniref:Uncharacterized protein n=1 Tax=Micromonospora phaseoli TaxID=1144548 RepID=A0A1H7DYF8_9ACTN|nr:hypothetical protein [Micromonospora phaseoli]PZV88772.1 hypothetical protein CLV64_11917 [Micromonospora phaseoli]GIJ81232.1 hypothetical protein Xph01_56640 [Micromonospora phaseoli]SEK06766.1 hypothetical protein SAMN05443287_12225 [Micromonospora phaseoli]